MNKNIIVFLFFTLSIEILIKQSVQSIFEKIIKTRNSLEGWSPLSSSSDDGKQIVAKRITEML